MSFYVNYSQRMKAVLIKKKYFWSSLQLVDVKIPQLEEDDVLVKVMAVGVNDEDLQYDTFKCLKGIAACPGLECSGTIEAVGVNVRGWRIGDEVCAILDHGGYAEKVVVPSTQLLRVPNHISCIHAASLPYVACIIWLALFRREQPLVDETERTILIHEGASAIGLMAIKIARLRGMTVIATAGTYEGIKLCHEAGAHFCINHTNGKTPDLVSGATNAKGVHYVLVNDVSRIEESFKCCAKQGCVLVAGSSELEKITINFGPLIGKNLQIRVLDLEEESKASIIEGVNRELWPLIMQHRLEPLIEHQMSLVEASRAHELMKEKKSKGKILLCN